MPSDDIVTRIREVERLVRNSQMDCDDTADLIEWCADEIERLRQRNDTLSSQPLNWVHVAQRLVQYINDTGPRQFDGVLDALAYLDSLEADNGQ